MKMCFPSLSLESLKMEMRTDCRFWFCYFRLMRRLEFKLGILRCGVQLSLHCLDVHYVTVLQFEYWWNFVKPGLYSHIRTSLFAGLARGLETRTAHLLAGFASPSATARTLHMRFSRCFTDEREMTRTHVHATNADGSSYTLHRLQLYVTL